MPESLRTNLTIPDVNSQGLRSRVPDRSWQQRQEASDGSQPLDFSGHEAVAQYLSLPKSLREFKSDAKLAEHFQVTRMTIYRWKHEIDVIQRALWLSMTNKIAGDLVIRVEWLQIVQKAVALAKKGNINAMKFLYSIAWANKTRTEQPVTLENLFDMAGLEDTAEGEE